MNSENVSEFLFQLVALKLGLWNQSIKHKFHKPNSAINKVVQVTELDAP